MNVSLALFISPFVGACVSLSSFTGASVAVKLGLGERLGLGNELDELVLVGAPVGPASGDDREGVGVISNPGATMLGACGEGLL
jgi:hypothetical protein